MTYNAAMFLSLIPAGFLRFSRACDTTVLRPSGGNKKLCMPVLLAALLFLGSMQSRSDDSPSLTIAVAANFRPAAEQLANKFTHETGIPVQISSASTGVLAAQMRRGAPFDILLAADRARPQSLVDDVSSPGPAECYALGSLVLLGAKDLESALSDQSKSVAIANPRSAPYGIAAEAVLARYQPANAAKRRIVRGGNVQQALQFYSSGGADLALVARSLSPTAGIAVPNAWHPPIEQYAVLNGRSENPATARRFLEYLLGPDSEPVLAAFGYQQCS
ncbi:molybdate ABC transporter substrate-binding protein [Congregibacter litoralis]|uniref:molybdate ABC transporter substrate-binding protein n=1 Tax=Congregibacter litoralis TaxID=393662 RepID=UPI00006B1879|nr:molybdate ABC transporter substrate-binding protein [Congregibacter litoralis]